MDIIHTESKRKEIQHIIATRVEKDEQAPDSLEDTLYWCIIKANARRVDGLPVAMLGRHWS